MDPAISSALVRTILFYFVLLISVRIMGKREVGALSPADLVVAILIAELAILPIEDRAVPLWVGLGPIALIVGLEWAISYASLKSRTLRHWVQGKPTVVVRDGMVLKDALRSQRYNLDEFLAQLREQGWSDLSDIEYAVLENRGDLSVVPKASRRPVCVSDLQIDVSNEVVPQILVKDGEVVHDGLKMLGLSPEWLEEEIKAHGVSEGSAGVFLASITSQGSLHIQRMQE